MSNNSSNFAAAGQAPVSPRLKRTVAGALGLAADALPDDAGTENTAAWSSLQHLAVIAAVEEEFGVTFTMDEMSSALSLPALQRAVAAGLPGGGGLD